MQNDIPSAPQIVEETKHLLSASEGRSSIYCGVWNYLN